MANLALGLDVGPNSLGWALIDEDAQVIVATGVRIFPEGVDRDQQGGEKSKSQTRRDARGMRRQLARRRRRKRRLREALTAIGLLPSDPSALAELLREDPYDLRRRATTERVTPHQLGRIFLHLNQRRGYLSNRKTDKARESDTKGMLAEIGELASALNGQTLGEYLAVQHATYDHCKQNGKPKIRGRHTRRDMLQNEFETIWEVQRTHHPETLTNNLKYGTAGKQVFPTRPALASRNKDSLERFGIWGLIFFQRNMYWPKSIVGRCDLEPKQKRCAKADRAAQRFRILQEVNNLRYLDPAARQELPLSEEQRRTLIDYLATTRERSFEQIRKKLKLHKSARFNFERADRNKLKGHETDFVLSSKKALGKRWLSLSEETKHSLVSILIHESQEDAVISRLVNECGLTQGEAKCAEAVHLPQGYMNVSRIAIDRLLPHLERGLLFMADDSSNSALHAAGYLRPDEREVRRADFLPPAPDVPNPIVRQALVEVRKVVNAILREYVYLHGHKMASIRVELAREAKKSFDERKEIRFANAKNRRRREEAATEIVRVDSEIKPTRSAQDRYLLWQEQGTTCPYCAQKISMSQLFNGDADIDHILPRWRSLDDSMGNKVLCHRTCNNAKGDRTPYEWLAEGDPDRFSLVLQCIQCLPYGKQAKFQQQNVELKDFVERQLRDTAYITRCVSQYLRGLGTSVICMRGQMTADLRHYWGLNHILDPVNGRKIRTDHRHHAVDAIVVALTNHQRLHSIANGRGKNLAPPWPALLSQARDLILGINVSHRAGRRLNGSLHEATLYGATQKVSANQDVVKTLNERPWARDWIEDVHTFVRRKPISDLTNTKQLVKIRDVTIRELVRSHLRDRGIDPDVPGKIPGDAIKGTNTPRMPSGVPIQRVRMLEESETFRQVSPQRSAHYVKPGNNHHIIYRTTTDGSRWDAEVITTWDAALRARKGLTLIDRDESKNGRVVMSLSIGEMFEIQRPDGEIWLCVVQKLDQRSKRVTFKVHTDARESAEALKDNLYLSPSAMRQACARKVSIDPLGRIRNAGD